jgi:hypothetical protein
MSSKHMLHLFRNSFPKEDFQQIGRLNVKLFSKQIDTITDEWEKENNMLMSIIINLSEGHFRQKKYFMKEYDFEYTKQGIAYLLFLLSFGVVALCMVTLNTILKQYIWLDVIFSIIVGTAFFLFNKNRIKRNGKAKLSSTGLYLELSEATHIAFSDLKYYYIYNGKNGIVFTLGFLDGRKLKITANNNFCNIEPIETLLTDIQAAVEEYEVQSHLPIIHLESILARKKTPYILSVITFLIILGFIFTKMPVMIIPIAFTLPIIANWIQYFRLKSNNKLVDF